MLSEFLQYVDDLVTHISTLYFAHFVFCSLLLMPTLTHTYSMACAMEGGVDRRVMRRRETQRDGYSSSPEWELGGRRASETVSSQGQDLSALTTCSLSWLFSWLAPHSAVPTRAISKINLFSHTAHMLIQLTALITDTVIMKLHGDPTGSLQFLFLAVMTSASRLAYVRRISLRCLLFDIFLLLLPELACFGLTFDININGTDHSNKLVLPIFL